MKYFAIIFAAFMLTAPAFSQRPDRGHHRPEARVEAHKGADLKAEVKALRKELEALKQRVARGAKGCDCKKAEGRKGRGRGRGSRGDSGARGKRGHKKEDKVIPVQPDWDSIRQRFQQRGWATKK